MPRQRNLLEILNDHESSLRRIQATLTRVASVSLTLDDLTDVTITGGATRHVLAHNGSGQYVNRLLVEADISDLGTYVTTAAHTTAAHETLLDASYVDIDGDTMTGPLLSPAGNAATPAYQIGVSDMGFYRIGAEALGISLGGALGASLREGRFTVFDPNAATTTLAVSYMDFFDNASHRVGLVGATSSGSPDFLLYADDGDLKLYPGGGEVLVYDVGQSAYVETFPKGTLVTMDTYTSTTDYTNVPASNTITHSTSVACEYASQPVYVEVTVKVRWKGMTSNSYVYSRPSVNGSGQGLVCVDEPDANSVGYLTQTSDYRGAFTADGSGNVVLGTQCYSEGATADVEEVTISYSIWRQ